MSTWVLILAKSLQHGKWRLRGVLSDLERRSLNEYFLRHTLETARDFVGVRRTAVISECAEVLQVSSAYGVTSIRQTLAPGLNSAATEGAGQLFRDGAASVLLMPVDTPLVCAADLAGVAARGLRADTAVICPDRHHEGTNAVLIPCGVSFNFCFGKGSFAAHVMAVREAGLKPVVHVDPKIGHDVDTVNDLRLWLRTGDVPQCALGGARVGVLANLT